MLVVEMETIIDSTANRYKIYPCNFCLVNSAKFAEFYPACAIQDSKTPACIFADFEGRKGEIEIEGKSVSYLIGYDSGPGEDISWSIGEDKKLIINVVFLVPKEFRISPTLSIWIMRSIPLPQGLDIGK